MLWGRPWKSFAEKRNGSGFYIRIFLAPVPMYQKTGKIQIFGYVSGSEENPKLENRYRMITWRKRFLEAAAAGILIGTLILIAGLLKTEEFSVAISEVTDLYYEARQYPEDSKDREKCCMAAEKRLQRLSRNYGEKEQQRRIELLLAWNAELLCEPEKAALYYENLLLYDAEYPVAYGEYGMFLIRTGQKEASRKLWEDYKEKEKAELLDDSESRNLQLWEEINEKKKRK